MWRYANALLILALVSGCAGGSDLTPSVQSTEPKVMKTSESVATLENESIKHSPKDQPAVVCEIKEQPAKVICEARNYASESNLQWASNATTRWGNGPNWDFDLGEIPVPRTIEISLEICAASDCEILQTDLDSGQIATPIPENSQAQPTISVQETVLSASDVAPPVLGRLPIGPFAPYDPASGHSGVLEFNSARFIRDKTMQPFIPYGGQLPKREQLNSTLEFHVPSDTLVYAPMDGTVETIYWHDNEGLHQDWDDWGIMIKPLSDNRPPTDGAPAPFTWIVEIDHVVSLNCQRPRIWPDVCRLLPVIEGVELEVGMTVKEGQVLGYAGNLADYENTGLKGRTEISIQQTTDDWQINNGYCPLLFLARSKRLEIENEIRDYISAYEKWADDANAYNEGEMVSPGCYYARAEYDNSPGGEWGEETWHKTLD